MPVATYTFPDGRKAKITFQTREQLNEAIAELESRAQQKETTEAQKRSFGQEVGRQLGLSARYSLEGPVQVASLFAQPLADVANLGLEAAGADYRFPNQAQAFSNMLTEAGFPEPEGATERVVADASRALAGGGGVLGAAQRTSGPIASALSQAPGAQAVGEVTSGAASGVTRESGGGPAEQVAAGLLGGFGGPLALESGRQAIGAAARGIRGGSRPFTQSGREQIVAELLREQATDPDAAAGRLQNATEAVSGSMPTTGAVSKDTGLVALEKALRSRNPREFGQRLSEQNAARQELLSRMAGTPEDVADDVARRAATTDPMREAALQTDVPADVSRVDRLISRILTGESGERQAVSTALNSVRKRLYEDYPEDDALRAARDAVQGVMGKRMSGNDFSAVRKARTALNSAVRGYRGIDEVIEEINALNKIVTSKTANTALNDAVEILKTGGQTVYKDDVSRLYGVRKHINDLLEGSGGVERAQVRAAQRELITVRDALDRAIEKATPGFRAYLDRYKELSRPINQKEILQEIQRRSTFAAPDPSTNREILSQAKFSNRLQKALSDPDAMRSLTDEQIRNLKAIAADLDMGSATTSATVRAPGSDTFQNLSLAHVISSAKSGQGEVPPGLRLLLKPLEKVYQWSGADDAVNEILVDAMMDPKIAAQLLKRPTRKNVQTLANLLRRRAMGLGLGATMGTAVQSQAPSSRPENQQESRPRIR